MERPSAETVLLFSGLDPSGAAGLAADIETINQFGVTPLPIVTSLTAQNTQKVLSVEPTTNILLKNQFRLIDEDIFFKTVKIGLLGSSSQIKTISRLLRDRENFSIIFDPIIVSSSDNELISNDMIKLIKKYLIPLCLILTPNLDELKKLTLVLDEQSAVESLKCPWILVTTSDSSEIEIEHRLYHHSNLVRKFTYKKLSGSYHGSGCTLSSAISALIASDVSVEEACRRALDYTYQTLLNAKKLGKMQYHPNRTYPESL